MIYFIVSWAIIGILTMILSVWLGMFVQNTKDYFMFVFACGPLVWILILITCLTKK
jgi:hypothetical protein